MISLEMGNVSRLPKAATVRCCLVPAAHGISSAGCEGRGHEQTGRARGEEEWKGKDPGPEHYGAWLAGENRCAQRGLKTLG